MTIKERLKNSFPNTISRNGTVFNALVVNDKGTAAIEYVLQKLIDYMAEWKSHKDIYETRSTALNYLANFFSFLEQFTDEKAESYLRRIAAIFVRNHDTVWGTPYNVLHTFRQYFNTDDIYLVENTGDTNENLIKNYLFNDLTFWDYSNIDLKEEARFIRSYGILYGTDGEISQNVSVNIGNSYWMHIFHKGNVKISVSGGHAVKWNHITESFDEIPAEKEFSSEEWNNAALYFIADESEITVKITGDSGTYVDYPRLFARKDYPSFTIMVQFTGDSSKNALALAPGETDPTEEIGNYSLAGYYDQDFITGANSGYAMDLYKELLSYVKAVGVMGYLEIVNRDRDKE